jgi:hypothetical protein
MMNTDIHAMIRELARTHFYGAIEIKLEDGKIVLIRKTENFKPQMEHPDARSQRQ